MTDLMRALSAEWLHLDLLGRLVLAAVLGGAIGLEREWSGKPAGLRTNLLICVGAALLTDLSITVSGVAEAGTPSDPGRIAAQIVSGIGFLGAGTIIQSRAGVVGLTTAATLWVVAAIGMAVGTAAYVEAVGATLLVLVSLLALGALEPRLARHGEQVLRVSMSPDPAVGEAVERALSERLRVQVVEAERREGRLVLTYHLSGRRAAAVGLVKRLMAIDGVVKVARS